jgi:CheY-like chemotaxis protein
MSDKKRILIVDDDHDILDLFEIYLYKDFEVVTAINGFEGLKKAQENSPDCVITDIMMPTMDGIKFINRFRKLKGFENVPVLAVTAFSSTLQEESLTSVGFKAVVSKPVSRVTLVSTIKLALEESVE